MATTRILNCIWHRRNSLLKIPSTSVTYLTINSNFFQSQHCHQKSVVKSQQKESGGKLQTNFVETVKENTKSAWYLGVIVAGVGVTCVMFYAIFRELFSSKSPNGVYSNALKRILKEPEVKELLGEPILAHGEETQRRRRGHVAHTLYLRNGVPHMRMQFYVKGSRTSGTVYLEVRENQSGNYEYRYLFLELNDYKRSMIVLEENRISDSPKVLNLS